MFVVFEVLTKLLSKQRVSLTEQCGKCKASGNRQTQAASVAFQTFRAPSSRSTIYYSSMAVQCVQKKGTAYSQALTGHAQNQKRIPRCDGQHRRRATIHTRRHDMPAVAFLRESSVSEDESCTHTVHTNSYRRTEYSFHTARYLVLCPKRNVHLNLIKDI